MVNTIRSRFFCFSVLNIFLVWSVTSETVPECSLQQEEGDGDCSSIQIPSQSPSISLCKWTVLVLDSNTFDIILNCKNEFYLCTTVSDKNVIIQITKCRKDKNACQDKKLKSETIQGRINVTVTEEETLEECVKVKIHTDQTKEVIMAASIIGVIAFVLIVFMLVKFRITRRQNEVKSTPKSTMRRKITKGIVGAESDFDFFKEIPAVAPWPPGDIKSCVYAVPNTQRDKTPERKINEESEIVENDLYDSAAKINTRYYF